MRPIDLSRRRLLRAGGSVAAASIAASLRRTFGADDAANPPPIIDTHQHLWDLKRFRLPWLDGAGDALNHTHSMTDYLEAAKGLNVVAAIYMEVAVEASQQAEEARYVIDLCRRGGTPTIAAVIGGRPEGEDFAAYIGQFANEKTVKGVRSSFDAGLASEHFEKNLRHLGEMNLSYDINTGPAGLARAAQVVLRCPDTRFVLDHCGNADATQFAGGAAAQNDATIRRTWEQGISALAERPNVICKISGVMEAAGGKASVEQYAAVVIYCLDRFGPDRVIFASNWPVVNKGGSFGDWALCLRSIMRSRPATEARKLFHDNAKRFYRLAND